MRGRGEGRVRKTKNTRLTDISEAFESSVRRTFGYDLNEKMRCENHMLVGLRRSVKKKKSPTKSAHPYRVPSSNFYFSFLAFVKLITSRLRTKATRTFTSAEGNLTDGLCNIIFYMI